MKRKPRVIRSKGWFFEVYIPSVVANSSGKSLLEICTEIGKEAYVSQDEHIKAIELREEAMSDILHQIVQKCTVCEVAQQAAEILRKK